MTNKELMEELDRAVNSDDGSLAKEMTEKVIKTHRTLQQLFVKMFFQVLVAVGEQPCSDARNEASVRLCKELKLWMEDKNAFFPYI